MPRTLIAVFSLVNLVVGTAAFMLSGILPALAKELQVSVPVAGQLMTAYALSVALLAPLALVATGRWERRRALVLAMLIFTLGCCLCAWASSYVWMAMGRVLMGVGAMFTPMAAGIVVALVAAKQRGRALAATFLGISLSYLLGLPLGNWLATVYGLHTPLWLVAGASALTLPLLWLLVPKQVNSPGASFKGMATVLRQPAVLSALAITGLYFTAIFATASYLVPVFQALVDMTPRSLALSLMAFGAAGVVGTVLGGFSNDRLGPRCAVAAHMGVLGLTMLALPFTQGQHWALLLVMFVWGAAGFGLMAPQQSRLAAMAPAQAPLLLSMNTSMLYLGTAAGAALGGFAVPLLGYGKLPWSGLPLMALALLLLACERNFRPLNAGLPGRATSG